MVSTLQQSGRARIFALLTLFVVLGLQSLEVGHSHVDHDGAVECLVCNSPSAGVASAASLPTVDEYVVALALVEETSAVPASPFSLYSSRGPPRFS